MSNNLAIVFPGQGSQAQNMLSDFYNNNPTFKATIEIASNALDYDLWDIIGNDLNKLNQTEYTQPAIVATSVALWNVYKSENNDLPKFLAGHSVGEYSALVAAEVISLEDAVKIVAERGRLMQNAVPEGQGAMAAIIGLKDDDVEKVCQSASNSDFFATPANFNSPGQVVIAGSKTAIENAESFAKELGAKRFIILDVSVPSHCKLMAEAASKLGKLLTTIEFKAPCIPVVHNFDVATHNDKESIIDALVKQLYSPVQWTKTVEFLANSNIEKVFECGPGKVLTGLNKRIVKGLEVKSLSEGL